MTEPFHSLARPREKCFLLSGSDNATIHLFGNFCSFVDMVILILQYRHTVNIILTQASQKLDTPKAQGPCRFSKVAQNERATR
jgi:hypothetical protein